jgi:hypothetical protein
MSGKKDIVSKEIEQIEREVLMNKYQTALKKGQFINELKDGLGNEIKINGGKVKVIQKSWYEKLKIYLAKIFTKF